MMTIEPASVDWELSRKAFWKMFADDALEQQFRLQRYADCALQNRVALGLAVLFYDLFFLAELQVSPEITFMSAICHFAIMTPLTLAFILLDWRGRVSRSAELWTATLIVCLTILASLEMTKISSPTAMANVRTVPFIQMTILTCRVGWRQAVVIAALSCVSFTLAILACVIVPSSTVGSLLLTEYALAVVAITFAFRLETRDRQVFLLNLQAVAGRSLLAAQNVALARVAQLDALTGLGNRRCFDETLGRLWGSEHTKCQPVTLVLLDIDFFKLFNNRYGHQAGDECLAVIGRVMSRCRRNDDDKLVRYGGEEFALLLPETGLTEGTVVAERLRRAVCDRAIPHPDAGPLPCVTISLGVATVLPSNQSAAGLVEAADRCLYAAKHAGRNRVVSCEGGPWSGQALGVAQVKRAIRAETEITTLQDTESFSG